MGHHSNKENWITTYFAHATAAVLSWHEQTSMVTTFVESIPVKFALTFSETVSIWLASGRLAATQPLDPFTVSWHSLNGRQFSSHQDSSRNCHWLLEATDILTGHLRHNALQNKPNSMHVRSPPINVMTGPSSHTDGNSSQVEATPHNSTATKLGLWSSLASSSTD